MRELRGRALRVSGHRMVPQACGGQVGRMRSLPTFGPTVVHQDVGFLATAMHGHADWTTPGLVARVMVALPALTNPPGMVV